MIELLNIRELFHHNKSELIFRGFIGAIALGIVTFSVAAPVIQNFFGYPAGEEIYYHLSGICHQYPTRSFWIFDRPFALCARCTTGYLGLMIFAFFFKISWNYSKRLLLGFLFLFLAVLDPFIQLFFNYESNNYLRFLSGIIGGAGFFLIINIFTQKNKD